MHRKFDYQILKCKNGLPDLIFEVSLSRMPARVVQMIKRSSKSAHLSGPRDRQGFCCMIHPREIALACHIATSLLLAGATRTRMVLASRRLIFSITPVSCRIHWLHSHRTNSYRPFSPARAHPSRFSGQTGWPRGTWW